MTPPTHTVDASEFLTLVPCYISEELAAQAESYIQENIIHLREFQDSRAENGRFKNLVTYATNEQGKIIGFRYMFIDQPRQLCNLFATYVEEGYRRQGIGRQLIEESFAVAIAHEIVEFTVRLTSPSPEKDALFELYHRYARENSNRFKFTIFYWTKMERHGYS